MNTAPLLPKPASDALDAYGEAGNAILNDFASRLESLPIPPMIFHYTNDKGLRGIIENGTFWFTDIFDLNDPSELSHGFSKAVEALKERLSDTKPEIEQFTKNIEAMGASGGLEAAAHFFVCSFSCDGDELGQWRAYGDDGRGFALGFDTEELEKYFTKDEDSGSPIPEHSTFPIFYDDSELLKLQRSLVAEMHALISFPRNYEMNKSDINDFMQELSVYHAVNAMRAVIFFKNQAYKNEQEYRFLQLFRMDKPVLDVKYRDRRPIDLFDIENSSGGERARVPLGELLSVLLRIETRPDSLPGIAAWHATPASLRLRFSTQAFRIESHN